MGRRELARYLCVYWSAVPGTQQAYDLFYDWLILVVKYDKQSEFCCAPVKTQVK
jgi:hypothetical protein